MARNGKSDSTGAVWPPPPRPIEKVIGAAVQWWTGAGGDGVCVYRIQQVNNNDDEVSSLGLDDCLSKSSGSFRWMAECRLSVSFCHQLAKGRVTLCVWVWSSVFYCQHESVDLREEVCGVGRGGGG